MLKKQYWNGLFCLTNSRIQQYLIYKDLKQKEQIFTTEKLEHQNVFFIK